MDYLNKYDKILVVIIYHIYIMSTVLCKNQDLDGELKQQNQINSTKWKIQELPEVKNSINNTLQYKWNNYLDKNEYWDLFRRKDILFCSQWIYNPKKIISILENWILSESKAKEFWIKIDKTNAWFNQSNNISVSHPPTNLYRNPNKYNSFEYYTLAKNNVSFVIKWDWVNSISQTASNNKWLSNFWISEFYDELFVIDIIPPENIVWIIIDEKKIELLEISTFLKQIQDKYWISIFNKKWNNVLNNTENAKTIVDKIV